ncbi:hypothetical protein PR202_gb28550 [Eleusine coracana subsp. coracana]|uniref:Uncharacterized protein n=1 Tax=Eleusine coracana subsp. coracana TaxID=191504 RepID=A0AAV5FXS8_ELECO|nr:hypothetical protein PR202_gb28550 [Eleusine coracana subsp. coracana]
MGPLLPTTSRGRAAALLLLPWRWSASPCLPLLRLKRRRLGRGSRRRLLLYLCSSASSSSYNGWGELPDFSFPLLLQGQGQGQQRKNGGLLLLVFFASAVALSRLPPLPLLAAAFTAGFAARHLSSTPPQPTALTLVLTDLDAQVSALRDHLTSSSSHSQLLHAVDRLRDAVLHATRLAHHHDITPPPPPPILGDLADSVAAWARDTMRDLTSTRSNSTPPNSEKDSDAPPNHNKPPPASAADMLPFHQRFDATSSKTSSSSSSSSSDLDLETLLLKHRRRRRQSSLLEKRTLEIRDRSYRLDIDYSDSHEFTRNLKEAAEILNKARECMLAGADEQAADALLYKSARLLTTAVALRPTSLVAVGQLGNTYLLHGELKLKISRELRALLANTGPHLSNATTDRVLRPSRKVLDNNTRIPSRDSISAALVDVCEECESLLVEAGRSYRTALSIDSADVKALYNWGLALIFRAQLLADIGPEAAVDADRVYLAAIDKFDAMLSKSNTYAPEALYRGGTALQQRSHLRPRNNREKIRLLEQAKSLFEDVLYVEADNKMVREALSSCISELNYHGRWI